MSTLAAFGIAETVASLLMPGDVDMPRWERIMFKTFLILLDLIPIAAGIAWLVFFTRKDVKAYFQTGWPLGPCVTQKDRW